MTKPAQEQRAKIVLGDDTVKQEIGIIDAAIEVASDDEQVSTIVTSAGIAGNYDYADWWYLEELFTYGIAYRGYDAGGGSLSRLPNITNMTMPQVVAALSDTDKTRHKQINAVLGHYRKFGYQIHPGNYFNAASGQKIKWFIDWNNTVFDHVHLIDDTLVIGKPDQIAPNGLGPAPIGPFAEGRVPAQSYPQTRIEFFGLGNKANSQLDVLPLDHIAPIIDTVGEMLDSELANIATDPDTGEQTSGATPGAALQTALDEMLYMTVEVQRKTNIALDLASRTGLIRGEFQEDGEDWAVQPGVKNSSGKGKDLGNLEDY